MLLPKIPAVEEAVACGFGDVGGGEIARAFEVGNAAGYLYYSREGSRRQPLSAYQLFQQLFALIIKMAELFHLSAVHFGIGKDALSPEALLLNIPRLQHPCGHYGAAFAPHPIHQLAGFYGMQP